MFSEVSGDNILGPLLFIMYMNDLMLYVQTQRSEGIFLSDLAKLVKLLGFVASSANYTEKDFIVSHVRLQFTYCSTIQRSHFIKDIIMIEQIQH